MVGILTSVFLLIGGVFSTLNLAQPVFMPIAKIQAIEAIDQDWNQQTQPIVIANYQTSNIVPAWIFAKYLLVMVRKASIFSKHKKQLKRS